MEFNLYTACRITNYNNNGNCEYHAFAMEAFYKDRLKLCFK